tara:strand:- start:39 stop:746 length:708 start_codon:yes stop_codon:yes gene_type:complete
MMAVVLLLLFPKNIKAQDDGIAGAAAGLLAVGGVIAAVAQIKESLELRAVEYILNEYPDLVEFELKTGSLNGTKFKDLSSVSVVTFELNNNNNEEKSVLFAFTSNGWANEYGVDFSKLMWKNFKKEEWNNLISKFVKMASGMEVPTEHISKLVISSRGIARTKLTKYLGKTVNQTQFLIEFDKLGGDDYIVSDYSDEFKIIYNEKSLCLYLKKTQDLVQLKMSTIMNAHKHINNI